MKKASRIVFTVFSLLCLAGCAGAMHGAAAAGDVKTLRTMLDSGVDINEINIAASVFGTPLHFASNSCQVEAVRLLLDKGVNVNIAAGYVRYTALRFAADKGCNEVVKLLLDKGAEIDARDRFGDTPLMSAAIHGQSATVKLLIERGADADQAIGRHMANDRKTAAQIIEMAAKRVGEGKTHIAARKDSRSPAVTSDIEEIPALTSEPRKNAYAVVIGIENYRSLPKSDYSGKDAELVRSYLQALGYPERNIDFLTDEKATKTDLEKSLEAWLPNRVKKDSTVLVYFSGHGAPDPATGEAYLVPYDGDPNYLPVTGYPLKRVYERLGKLGAEEIIVILDSCFSGTGGRSVLAKGARPLVMMAEAGTLAANMAVMTATGGAQISTSSPERGHGIFTYHFLKAIKDGHETLADIYANIKPRVEDEAKLLNVQQSPSINPAPEKLARRFILRK